MIRRALIPTITALPLLLGLGACGSTAAVAPPAPQAAMATPPADPLANPESAVGSCLMSDGFLDLVDSSRDQVRRALDLLAPAGQATDIGQLRKAVDALNGRGADFLVLGREFAGYPDCGDRAVGNLLDALGSELVTDATYLELLRLDEKVDEEEIARTEALIRSLTRLEGQLGRLRQALTPSSPVEPEVAVRRPAADSQGGNDRPSPTQGHGKSPVERDTPSSSTARVDPAV